MQAATLLVRGFRNLADRTLELPAAGMALVGPNGHGKTNLLEALAYPVLFRSLRGARDRDVARFGGPGFHVEVTRSDGVAVATTWRPESKQVTVDGTERERIADALGAWLAVAFLPTDRGIVQGGAAERRRWVDRMLSLARPTYLEALMRYRAALVRRNAALRKGDAVSAAAFDPQLARAGAAVVAERLDWAGGAGSGWRNELAELGEALDVTLEYRGDAALADPDQWAERLAKSAPRDRARGQTHVGPHRDDLTLGLAGKHSGAGLGRVTIADGAITQTAIISILPRSTS